MAESTKQAPAAEAVAPTAPAAGRAARRPARAAAKPAAKAASPKPAASGTQPAPAVPATAAATAKARPVRKPSRVDQTVARQQKELAAALEKATAIDYTEPVPAGKKAAKTAKTAKIERPVKAEKAVKPRKPRLVRDSYAMPEGEYARIGEIKKRLAVLGGEAKKSEVLRAGIALLAGLGDAELQAALASVERIKTGRPAKK